MARYDSFPGEQSSKPNPSALIFQVNGVKRSQKNDSVVEKLLNVKRNFFLLNF